jgi:hypothetical protein
MQNSYVHWDFNSLLILVNFIRVQPNLLRLGPKGFVVVVVTAPHRWISSGWQEILT